MLEQKDEEMTKLLSIVRNCISTDTLGLISSQLTQLMPEVAKQHAAAFVAENEEVTARKRPRLTQLSFSED